jgi:hypothetical protein
MTSIATVSLVPIDLTSSPSDANSLAYAKWTTPAPSKRRGGGTAGTYKAMVTGVIAGGYGWDGTKLEVTFYVN